jgi:hypothetical protein
MNSTNNVEKIGAYAGIAGALLAASGFGLYGYPLFTLSSMMLIASSYKQKNFNLLKMQSAFLAANAIGIYTFCIG